jgi:opacity protein-like surface antigen
MNHRRNLFYPWLLGAMIATSEIAFGGAGIGSSAAYYVSAGVGGAFSNTHDEFTGNSNSVLYSPTAVITSLFTLPNINLHNQFKAGFDVNVAIGEYINPNWRADVEFLYQNLRRDSYGSYGWLEQVAATGAVYAQQANNPISKVSNRANVYSLLTNLAYDFIPSGKWKPLLGVGAGVAWLKAGRLQTNNMIKVDDPITPLVETAPAIQNSPSLYGTAFAYQFKAGVSRSLTERITAILQYRLYGTTRFKASSATILTNPGTAGQTLFYSSPHDVKGLLINAIEVNMRFNV